MKKVFNYLDSDNTSKGKLLNQLFPIFTCIVLFIIFILTSRFYISNIINKNSIDKILLELKPFDIVVGFFLYFVTAIDYALIVGRMQTVNTGSKSRFAMNVGTCVGCYFGVSLVLFLWGFAKESPFFIIPLLFFAASVMVKLAYEGHEYFMGDKRIPSWIREVLMTVLRLLFIPAKILTFWMPDLGSPKTKPMNFWNLFRWSLFLPFIIGVDDLIGYMGAMTIYNVYSLLFGIYLADILIDILIFVSPKFTAKLVESSTLSILAALAFLYLGYKSFTEALNILVHVGSYSYLTVYTIGIGLIIFVIVIDTLKYYLFGQTEDHIRGK